MKAKILKKFEDEVAQLEHELKTELPKEIQRARELGDLRENAEYQAAKDRQTIVNSRLAMLRKRMAEIAIMNMDKIPHDRAAFGSTVHLTEDNGDKIIYTLVMPEEAVTNGTSNAPGFMSRILEPLHDSSNCLRRNWTSHAPHTCADPAVSFVLLPGATDVRNDHPRDIFRPCR